MAKVPAACTAAPLADTDRTDQKTADKVTAEVRSASEERVRGRADETPYLAAVQGQSASA